jgi:hypothetical protein
MKLALLAVATSALALSGCAGGVVSSTGAPGADGGANAPEPIQVAGGQFFPGTLPPSSSTGRELYAITVQCCTIFEPGLANWRVVGDAEIGAYSIGIAFEHLGTGYWTVPVGEPDKLMPGWALWLATCNFSPDIPTGMHILDFIAIDKNGNAGPVTSVTLQIL